MTVTSVIPPFCFAARTLASPCASRPRMDSAHALPCFVVAWPQFWIRGRDVTPDDLCPKTPRIGASHDHASAETDHQLITPSTESVLM